MSPGSSDRRPKLGRGGTFWGPSEPVKLTTGTYSSVFLQLCDGGGRLLFLCSFDGRLRGPSLRHNVFNIRRIVARRWTAVQAQLSEAAEIDGVAEDPRGLLRSMEAHGILGHYEVNHELSFALVIASRNQLSVCCSFCLLGFDVPNQVHKGIKCGVTQIEESVLNLLHPHLQFLFWKVMTRLAGAIDLEQRTVDLVVADLEPTLPHVGHMAIRASHAGACVHALVPHLKLGMAGLDELSAAIRTCPFIDFVLILNCDDVLHFQALRPRERQPLIRRLEIIGHVAHRNAFPAAWPSC